MNKDHSARDDGGPAFPVSRRKEEQYMDQAGYGRVRGVTVLEGGMTLRDYFAAKAMPAVLQLVYQGKNVRTRDSSAITEETIAAQAYAMADAMLKAREA